MTAPVLDYFDSKHAFILDTDTNNVGLGVVLSQDGEKGERVAAYFSHSLSTTEWNYCLMHWELLTVVVALLAKLVLFVSLFVYIYVYGI